MRISFSSIIGCSLMVLAPMQAFSQASESAEPFHVATFAVDGTRSIGLVLRDQLVVEIAAANNNLQQNSTYPEMAMPDSPRSRKSGLWAQSNRCRHKNIKHSVKVCYADKAAIR